MRINKYFQLGSFLFATLLWTACGDDSSSSATDESSSSVASFKSSSSLSNRADIDYKDTVRLGDTMQVYIELFKGDSSKMDTSEIYLDSTASSLPIYIGEFTKGSRIKVYATASNIEEDRIQIKSEYGNYLQALTAVPKEPLSKDVANCEGNGSPTVDSAYGNYFSPSFGCIDDAIFRDSNEFVVFEDNHYYLETSGIFDDESSLRFKIVVDTAYYNYTGSEKDISIGMNDTLRGIIDIATSPENISVAFSAKEGYSINLTVKGQNIISYQFTDGTDTLGKYKSKVDTMLIPTDEINWQLDITPENFSNFQTGPFAFFEAKTKSRALEQGEYFSYPDSIPYPGEYFVRTRSKDDLGIYKYNLLQEQFVWLGDYKKGDSILVFHHIENYFDDDFENVTCEILDKNQKVQGAISFVYGGSFSVSEKMPEGPYYLHYRRLNSAPKADVFDSLRYVLQLYTMVQQPGILSTFEFYDPEKDETYSEISLPAGDSIRVNDIQFHIEVSKNSNWDIIGEDVSWFIPCQSLNYINNSSNIYSATNCDEEKDISSDYLIAQEAGVGEIAELIAQSKADPTKRDTLKISIIAKVN